jgi:hypothetical protein
MSGDQILDDVENFLNRFVIYPGDAERVAHVLWIGHCWFLDAFDSTPRLAFLSPEPGSGKSRALEVTEPLVPRPVHAVNVSANYLFRKVSDEAGPPTILYDEIDTVFGPKAKENEEIRGLLNAGHRKGAFAGRAVVRGTTVGTEELPAYCAVALAGLDDLPDTIMTRSVVVRMRRRAPGERVEPWRMRINGPDAELLAIRLAEWSNANQHTITARWPEMPEGIEDRNADVWEALLAVADLAGGDWPERARVAAVTAVTDSRETKTSMGIMLLRDIRTVFSSKGLDRISTTSLLESLNSMDESPWGDIRGKQLDPRSLSRRLSKYGISPGTFRQGEVTAKGYMIDDFTDSWDRYLPPHGEAEESVTDVTAVTDRDRVTTVTDKSHGAGVHLGLSGEGRCAECELHVQSQGHRNNCTQAVAS